LLIGHFIALFNAKLELAPPRAGVERKALAAMRRYQWPGNVRELANAIESAVTLGAGPMIELEDLPATITGVPSSVQAPVARSARRSSLDATERETIRRALATAGGNKTTAAKLLKVSRKMLYTRLTKYGLG